MVLSVIKEIIKQADPEQYKRYFEHNVIKPYSFSVYLPKPEFTDAGFKIAEPRLDVTFSTAYWDDIAWLHNGLLQMRERSNCGIQYKEHILTLGKIFLVKEPRIESSPVRFKTLSPIVLRSYKESIHKDLQVRLFKDGLETFNTELNRSMQPLISQFMGVPETFSFNPVNEKFHETIMKVQDNGEKSGVLFGHKGMFELHGTPELLTLLAQTGLGSRRGYGLGCIELVA